MNPRKLLEDSHWCRLKLLSYLYDLSISQLKTRYIVLVLTGRIKVKAKNMFTYQTLKTLSQFRIID